MQSIQHCPHCDGRLDQSRVLESLFICYDCDYPYELRGGELYELTDDEIQALVWKRFAGIEDKPEPKPVTGLAHGAMHTIDVFSADTRQTNPIARDLAERIIPAELGPTLFSICPRGINCPFCNPQQQLAI